MFEAIVFDLDGTLVDSAPDLRAALNRLLAEEGRAPLDLTAVIGMVGDGAARLVERGLAATGGAPEPAALGGLVERFLAHYAAEPVAHSRPYAGVPETLRHLSETGYRLAVCTNKPRAATAAVLEGLDLVDFFSAVIAGDSLPQRKPAAEPLLAALDGLTVAPARAVMVGDSGNDVATARAAGIPVIVVEYGYAGGAPSALGADLTVARFAHIPAALGRLRVAPPA